MFVLQRLPEAVKVWQLPLVRRHVHHGAVRPERPPAEAHTPPLEYHALVF